MFLENKVDKSEQRGWIEVITGSMFSGKTEELLRRLRRARIAGQRAGFFFVRTSTTSRWKWGPEKLTRLFAALVTTNILQNDHLFIRTYR